jgi:hypothetical protein
MRTGIIAAVVAAFALTTNVASAEGLIHLKRPLMTRTEGLIYLKRPLMTRAEGLIHLKRPLVAVA